MAAAAQIVAWEPPVVARLTHPGLEEVSGLAPCGRLPGFFWAINDSGNPAEIFAFDRHGQVAGPPFQLQEATNLDWEAVVCAEGNLYVCDTGDNESIRPYRTVYVLPEPDPRQGGPVRPARKLHVRFPQQQPGVLEFDCEAVFYRDKRLWFVAKHRTPQGRPAPTTRLYRMNEDEQLTLVDQCGDLGGFVTEAALSPDGTTLAILALSGPTPSRAWLTTFELPARGDKLLSGTRRQVRLDGVRQVESMAFLDASTLLIANEQRDLFMIKTPK
jgi:hypothetical protein